jgi:hypothetical protein
MEQMFGYSADEFLAGLLPVVLASLKGDGD